MTLDQFLARCEQERRDRMRLESNRRVRNLRRKWARYYVYRIL